MSRESLAILFPNIEDFLELDAEELGAAVLGQWESHANRQDRVRFDTFIERIYSNPHGDVFPKAKQEEFIIALAEAWSWLEHSGLIIPDPRHQMGTWYLRTRRAREFQVPEELEAYKFSRILDQELLQPTILQKAYPSFRRGEYDLSVFQAFKTIEVEVKRACGFKDEMIGVSLMRRAFDSKTGLLTDMTTVVAEREAMASLFAVAIGHAKNPHSHRDKAVPMTEAARLLAFASHLMDIVVLRSLFLNTPKEESYSE